MLQEIPKDRKLSGHSYVRAITTDGELDRAVAITIRRPGRCDHKATVCTDCLHEWENDWKFYFSRTEGGRNLAAMAGRG